MSLVVIAAPRRTIRRITALEKAGWPYDSTQPNATAPCRAGALSSATMLFRSVRNTWLSGVHRFSVRVTRHRIAPPSRAGVPDHVAESGVVATRPPHPSSVTSPGHHAQGSQPLRGEPKRENAVSGPPGNDA